MSTLCVTCKRVLNDGDADKAGRCCFCVPSEEIASQEKKSSNPVADSLIRQGAVPTPRLPNDD